MKNTHNTAISAFILAAALLAGCAERAMCSYLILSESGLENTDSAVAC